MGQLVFRLQGYFILKMRSHERIRFSIALRLQNELDKVCPVDKGPLHWSIKVKMKGNIIRITMLYYGYYVEFGRPPRVSKSKKNKGKKVKTKGSRPNPFIRNTIRNKLPNIIREEMNK